MSYNFTSNFRSMGYDPTDVEYDYIQNIVDNSSGATGATGATGPKGPTGFTGPTGHCAA